jgi:hypothetical protein
LRGQLRGEIGLDPPAEGITALSAQVGITEQLDYRLSDRLSVHGRHDTTGDAKVRDFVWRALDDFSARADVGGNAGDPRRTGLE